MGKNKLMKRKVCIVTGSRADYGHLLGLMRHCVLDPVIKLQVVVTGSHLSKEQGNTYRQILKDGFVLDGKVDISKFDDSSAGITKRIGLACEGFADMLKRLKPDVVVVLGDRYEIFAATTAAYVANIAVAHLHGGESTEGALDEGFRHAITKMSHIHFASTEEYRKRIIQLGEQPKNVFNFGAPCLDVLRQTLFLSKEKLSQAFEFDLNGRCAIVTFHPATLEPELSIKQLNNILMAIRTFDLKVVFTKANMDPQGRKINEAIARFCRRDSQRYLLVDSLGQQKYYSCLRSFDLMIGNSSSGIIEAPSFSLPVVNVGDRQKGRIRARNIIDSTCTVVALQKAIAKALSVSFKKSLQGMRNPYERYRDGQASRRIKEQLMCVHIDGLLLKKEFYNIKI